MKRNKNYKTTLTANMNLYLLNFNNKKLLNKNQEKYEEEELDQ